MELDLIGEEIVTLILFTNPRADNEGLGATLPKSISNPLRVTGVLWTQPPSPYLNVRSERACAALSPSPARFK